MSLIHQLGGSLLLMSISIALFVCSSITTFDKRIIQAKRAGVLAADHPNLPEWVALLHLLDWALLITLLILNWRVGLLVWVVLFTLKVLPVLEIIGNVLMAPFSPKVQKDLRNAPNRDSDPDVDIQTQRTSRVPVSEPRNAFWDESEAPLGNVTYEEATVYFTRFCELMQQEVGFPAKESRLPTSYERMKEALKVECLNWCNYGARFDESSEFILQGLLLLANFVPDDLAEKASREAMRDGAEGGDREAFEAAKRALAVAQDLALQRLRELNIEWNGFVKEYRDKYVFWGREGALTWTAKTGDWNEV